MTTQTIEAVREGVLWREAPPYFDDLEIGDSMESSRPDGDRVRRGLVRRPHR